MSRTQRAKAIGVSEAMLRRHEAWGTITPEPDGSWDLDSMRAKMKAVQNPAREHIDAVGHPRLSRGVKAPVDAVAPPKQDPKVPPVPPARAGGVLTFNEARAVNENLKAARLKLELAELEGRLIDRVAVMQRVRALAQQERDAILSWPSRAAALIAADLGVNEHDLHAALDASLRAHLTERADEAQGI